MSYTFITIFMVLSYLFLVVEEITSESKKLLEFIIAFLFIILVSVRSLETPDTYIYALNFQQLKISLSDILYSPFESGFVIYSMIIKFFIGSNFRLYFGVIAFTNLFLLKKIIKRYDISLTIMPLLIYLSFYGLYYNFIILRAGLSFTLLLYAWSTFKENKILSIFSIILATLFHQSAILGILGYLGIVNARKISQKYYYIWLAILMLVYILRIDMLFYNSILQIITKYNILSNHKYLYYIQNMKYIEGTSFRFLFNYFIAIFLVFSNKNKSDSYDKLLNIYIIGISVYAIFPSFMWIDRITDSFIATNFLLLSVALNTFRNKNIKIIFCLPVIAVNLLFVLRIIH